MTWDKFYTAFITIERNPDGSFKRDNGQKKVVFLEKWQDATQKTQAEIDQHFKNYNAGLALLTGQKNGITVIDFDTKDNDLMLELYEVAPTKVIETEKGFHFYYRYCPDPALYTKAGAFGDGVDCRNNGGVIFCPPTPNYRAWNTIGLSDLSPPGLELLKSKSNGKKKIDIQNTNTRNDDLFRMACGWVDHYDEKEVWSKMVRANKEFRKGELPEPELETLYQQAIKYKKTGQNPAEVAKYVLRTLEEIDEDPNGEERFSIGIKTLDDIMRDPDFFGTAHQGGFAIGELIAIAGRPGHGKTLLAAQLTTSLQQAGIIAQWFSFEVNLKILKRQMRKMGASLSMVNSIDIAKEAPLLGNIDWIEEKIKESVRKYGTRLVVIDNLDFLETRQDRDSEYSMNQQAFLSSIVSELHKIALQYQIILILLAHVRKPSTATLKIKRPYLYDIAGTSAVERLCSFGIIIDREMDSDENFSQTSFLYLDKNRASGVRKKVTMEYKNGRLEETRSELLEYAKNLGYKEVNF